ncbi:hypothetical protein [Gelidibacter pelagius]|uniref:Uncharacterized protein n=1 Tax=Gelidibacter pelagius TaxID=2819985 RepID=A0ABS3SVV7_9FLAO|nr:hypothetical protein [Gelidibacter pelagius]MBO3099844.1 hypothetical protein [Gelidibacter pelagius]
MKKFFTSLLILNLLFLVSCKNKTENQSVEPELQNDSVSNEVINTYAVIPSLITENAQKFNDNISQQASQLNKLWEEGIVENLYYNVDGQTVGDQIIPTIAYFIRATDIDKAKNVLDQTVFRSNNIGTFELIPVGNFLFGQSEKAEDVLLKKQNAYVVVWDLLKPYNDIDPQDIKKQFDADFKLYEEGVLENAYKNAPYDESIKNFTVYFMNAESEEEAIEILNEMPFVKSNIASFKIRDVGHFMRGRVN